MTREIFYKLHFSTSDEYLVYRLDARFILRFCSAHAITADVSIAETAKAAEFFLSDGVIVTGAATAVPADLKDLLSVKKAVKIPVLIGKIIIDQLHHLIRAVNGRRSRCSKQTVTIHAFFL